MNISTLLAVAGAAILLIFGAALLNGSGFPVANGQVEQLLEWLLVGSAGGAVGYAAGQRSATAKAPH